MKNKTPEIIAVEEEMAAIKAQLAPLQEAWKEQYEKLESLRKEQEQLLFGGLTEDTPLDQIDWEELLHEDGSGLSIKRKAVEKVLRRFGDYGKGLGVSGYFPETEQTALRIAMHRGDKENLEQTYKGLTYLLPYIEPLSDGYAHIGIFETTLSERGSYSILIGKEEIIIQERSWGSDRDMNTFSDLFEALKYVQERLWYVDPKQEED